MANETTVSVRRRRSGTAALTTKWRVERAGGWQQMLRNVLLLLAAARAVRGHGNNNGWGVNANTVDAENRGCGAGAWYSYGGESYATLKRGLPRLLSGFGVL